MVALGWLTSNAMAKKDGCPDDQTCTWAIKYDKNGEEKFRQCMPIQADLGNGMVRTDKECGKKKKDPTSTKEIKITYTPKPKDPTNTPFKPEPTKAPPNPTRRPNDPVSEQPTATIQYAVTPVTPYVMTVTNLEDCPEDCICLLVTEAYIGNHLDRERNFLMETQNAIMQQSLDLQRTVAAP